MTTLIERITIDPAICRGKPTIRGLRYPIENILELLSAGMTPEEILNDYEDLEREDISAALLFATRLLQVKRTVVLDPDVFAYFSDAESVNQALRTLISIVPQKKSA